MDLYSSSLTCCMYMVEIANMNTKQWCEILQHQSYMALIEIQNMMSTVI
jgi:hypothetical protein